MITPAPAVSRSAFTSPGAAPSARAPAAAGYPMQRDEWVQICAARLARLRPGSDPAFVVSVARDMWADVASFDPLIAAEIEHESWPSDD